jgi:hypothetical protein
MACSLASFAGIYADALMLLCLHHETRALRMCDGFLLWLSHYILRACLAPQLEAEAAALVRNGGTKLQQVRALALYAWMSYAALAPQAHRFCSH